MKSSNLLLALIISGFLLISCVPFEKKVKAVNYINNHDYGTDIANLITQASKSIYRIRLDVEYEVGGRKESNSTAGIAFAIDKHRLFTVNHVTYMDYYEINTPFGRMKMEIEKEDKIKEWLFIVRNDGSKWPVKIIYQDKKNDFAVLESMNALVDPIYTIGNSDKFRILDTVISVSDFGAGLSARLGHISQLKYIPEGKLNLTNNNIFGFTAVIAPGDSGSPIFVVKGGKLEVGGITRFIIRPINGMGFGIKITPIMELLYAHPKHAQWVFPLLYK